MSAVTTLVKCGLTYNAALAHDIFFEIHSDLEREGPGDATSTQRAFRIVEEKLPEHPSIIDIGCGPGTPTLELSRMTQGTIVALDSHQPFLDVLDRRIRDMGVRNVIATHGSMEDLDFPDETFDLIWSEGAMYIMGFAKGLMEWKRFFKPHGLLAVSHITWLRDDVPPEPKAYWDKSYPEMVTIGRNCDAIAKEGYTLVDQFTLPKSAWEEYYGPQQARLDLLRTKYSGNPDALEQIADAQYGIDLLRSL